MVFHCSSGGSRHSAGSTLYTKIGDACVRRRGLWNTLRDRRDDEQRGSPYDATFNVAEIGAVNMGEIGAVRKRSR